VSIRKCPPLSTRSVRRASGLLVTGISDTWLASLRTKSKNPVQGYATMSGVLQSIAIPEGVCGACRGSGVRIEGTLSLPKKKSYCRRQEPHSQKCSTRSPSASSRMTRTTLPSRRYVSFFRQEGLKHSEIISKALLSEPKQRGSSTKQVAFLGLESPVGILSLWRACLASGSCLRAMI
jgi:hypothetical protein